MNSFGRLLVVMILLFALLVMSRPAPLRVAPPPPPAAPEKASDSVYQQWCALNDRFIDAEAAREQHRRRQGELNREIITARLAARQYLDSLEIDGQRIEGHLALLRERLAQAEAADLPDLEQDLAVFHRELRKASDPSDPLWRTADNLTQRLRHQIDERRRAKSLEVAAEARMIELRAAVARFRQDHLWLAEGTITEIHDNGRVSVSLGTADGVQNGHVLRVPRDRAMYQTRLAVVAASVHSAVCHLQDERFPVRPDERVVMPYQEVGGCGGVRGVVLAVSGDGLFEISMGLDDGVNKGAVLTVHRADGATYLGRAEVVDTRPDRSVCRTVEGTLRGVITKGDRVSYTAPGGFCPY